MENILRPGRYINNEWNAIHKEWKDGDLKVALCFPDVYEIGMSHLGMKILYGILNSQEGVICERVFAPWIDMEKKIRAEHGKLCSLESSHALKEFDIIGFSLQYEMNYLDVVNMLDLGGVPLHSKDRGDGDPVIIAGGPCAFNPEPMVDFIDAFVIGEAEEVVLEIAKVVQGNREKMLKELAKIEGVYVPACVIARSKAAQEGHCEKSEGRRSNLRDCFGTSCLAMTDEKAARNDMVINKRFIKDLDSSFFPTDIIVPYIQIVHDRIGIEIMRGCPHRCRFCQACRILSPFRLRSVTRIMEIAEESVKNTGYEEISLLSLSSGDYPYIEELARKLEERFKPTGVKISLPSLRVGTFEGHNGMATLKRAGLTFAPEAGTERLRNSLNKGITDAEIIEKSRMAFSSGWKKVKLYFMVGLPGETGEDLDAIIELSSRIKKVNLSITPFIPKPHSDFEREGMDGMGVLKEKQLYLGSRINALRSRPNIKLDFHSPEMGRVEAVLARGDRNIGKVILKAWQSGLRLQAWTEHFNYNLWEQAFQETGIDPEIYLKKKEENETLAWGFIGLNQA